MSEDGFLSFFAVCFSPIAKPGGIECVTLNVLITLERIVTLTLEKKNLALILDDHAMIVF